MIKILIITLVFGLMFFLYCLCRISSMCSRKEEYEEDTKKNKKTMD